MIENTIQIILDAIFIGIITYVAMLIFAILERMAKVKDPIEPKFWLYIIVGFILSIIKFLG